MIRAIGFDFDGVLVESVSIKTRAFAQLFASCDQEVLWRIIDYHKKNGGVSRYEKFRFIHDMILQTPISAEEIQVLGERFSTLVKEAVIAAPWVKGAEDFLVRHAGRYRLFVISGTPETELREIIARRGMVDYFEEILGSPRTKEALLRELLKKYQLQPHEILFVGDAETDLEASRLAGTRFILRDTVENATIADRFLGSHVADLSQLDRYL